VKASITTMLTLASSQGDGLYKDLAGKYLKHLHKGCLYKVQMPLAVVAPY
jgi:hypothetical protein